MREIKFRAWIKDENRMIYHPNILECCIQELDFSNVCRNYIQGTNPDEYERLTIPARITNRFYGKGLVELMQYTGLKDKNGREIYEGDIVSICGIDFEEVDKNEGTDEFYYENHELPFSEIKRDVVTMDRFPIYWLKEEKFGYEGVSLVMVEDCVVIGNIYENPELLE